MIALREGNYAVELVALHPILVLAGLIARVRATLEHRHHDDLDWNPLGESEGGNKQREGVAHLKNLSASPPSVLYG